MVLTGKRDMCREVEMLWDNMPRDVAEVFRSLLDKNLSATASPSCPGQAERQDDLLWSLQAREQRWPFLIPHRLSFHHPGLFEYRMGGNVTCCGGGECRNDSELAPSLHCSQVIHHTGWNHSIPSHNYGVIAVTEIWWDIFHDWSVTTDCWKILRRDKWGRKGGHVALYNKEGRMYEEFSLKNGHEQVESLWVKIRGWGNKGSLLVDIFYKPLDQTDTADEHFFLQLQKMSWLEALILLGD